METRKPKVVVVMGATGTGKSRLAIDLASYFPVEIINADSMQVYKGLDVLTNKVPLADRKGVPHHLLGSVDANMDFTSKDFRDSALHIIDDILSRNCLPVIVGGTNYYIQALVSPFLVDDLMEEMGECCLSCPLGGLQPNFKFDPTSDDLSNIFERLKAIDPAAASRIHPNDYRKVNHYLSLYASSGVLPSKLFQGSASEKWGRADNFKYECCFIWMDASLTELDRYVVQRVDSMMNAGLLDEVCDIYSPNSDYTRGLRQAIGVREFEDFLRCYLPNTETRYTNAEMITSQSSYKVDKILKPYFGEILESAADDEHKILLCQAIDKFKANTRKLVRRQKRRLNRLNTFFGWGMHCLNVTEAFMGNSGDSWQTQVVGPCVNMIRTFLYADANPVTKSETVSAANSRRLTPRDLWTQYVCEACGNRILRGSHEWEQHKQGRGHRKRVLSLQKKSRSSCLENQQQCHKKPQNSCLEDQR